MRIETEEMVEREIRSGAEDVGTAGNGGIRVEKPFAALEMAEVEPWPDAVDGSRLLEEIADILRRFVVMPKWGAETVALWTVHTYAFQLRDVSTYIGIESPEKRCGKTTLLGVLSELVNRPVVAANISSPAFFRVIEETRPTLLIDEADTFLQGNDELRGILNSGYSRKTAYVVRVQSLKSNVQSSEEEPEGEGEGALDNGKLKMEDRKYFRNGKSQLARFSCWCPKVMAAIGRFPDVLADRCIVIRMQRKRAQEKCERLRHLDASALRRQCARFVKDNAAAIADAKPLIPENLNDRAADIWEPLLALADLAGGPWPELGRQAASALTNSAQENSPIGSLLLDILILFCKFGSKRVFSRDLVASLATAADRPWASMMKGRALTEVWLAQQLRPYDVRPRTLWIDNVAAKGYVQEDFREVFGRYVPRSELEALREEMQAGVKGTGERGTGDHGSAVKS